MAQTHTFTCVYFSSSSLTHEKVFPEIEFNLEHLIGQFDLVDIDHRRGEVLSRLKELKTQQLQFLSIDIVSLPM